MPAYASLDTIIEDLRINWGGSLQGQHVDWSVRTAIDYAFLTGGSGREADHFVLMSPLQQTYAQLAFDLWDDVVALDINRTGVSWAAEINFAYSSATTDDGSYTSVSGSHGDMTSARIWLNSGWDTHDDDADLFFGSYGFTTYLHEIGHSLGLTHPGDYDASDRTAPTYRDDAAYAQDTRKYTVMSYFDADADGSGTDHYGSDGMWSYGAAPLLHDIAAMQAIYGADTTTRTGNTVYGFNSNAGRIIDGMLLNPFDFDQNPSPVFAIWDAGGTDTIDASRYTMSQRIDLAEGAFSSIGGMTDNIAIAFGAVIENAIGGSGDDEIRGNSHDNTLTGGAGRDTLIAGFGHDTLYGGPGADILMGSGGDSLFGGANNDTYYVTEGDTVTELLAGDGTDKVYTTLSSYSLSVYVENLAFSNGEFYPTGGHTGYGNASANEIVGAAGNDTFYGNGGSDHLHGREGDDRLYGGTGGDYLYGEAGADRLVGDAGADHLFGGAGKDTLTGGPDADIFVFNRASDSWRGSISSLGGVMDYVDTITDFVAGVDRIDLSGIDANAATPRINDAFVFLPNPADHVGDWTALVWIGQTAWSAPSPFGSGVGTPLIATTTLYASTDADPDPEFQVDLNGLIALTRADILL